MDLSSDLHALTDTRLLTELNDMLSSLLLYTPLNADAAHQLTTAVREMGVNAIEWGHRKRLELLVTVTYRIEADRVVITIKDTGPGFNPAAVRSSPVMSRSVVLARLR